jgi:hypothetical protein
MSTRKKCKFYIGFGGSSNTSSSVNGLIVFVDLGSFKDFYHTATIFSSFDQTRGYVLQLN